MLTLKDIPVTHKKIYFSIVNISTRNVSFIYFLCVS